MKKFLVRVKEATLNLGVVVTFVFASAPASASAQSVNVGSKAFTEGYLLGELTAQVIEAGTKKPVVRRFGLGNTGVTYEALKKGEIDLYPEYTGTISEAILHDPSIRNLGALEAKLKTLGLILSRPLGFNNTYALAVSRKFAVQNRLVSISDLAKLRVPLRSAFSHEFVSRSDGLVNLQKVYQLDLSRDRQSMEHSLAYEAIAAGKVDLIDVYSTDAKVQSLDLVVLNDDREYFPRYRAVVLARAEFATREPEAWAAIQALKDTINESTMRRLNAAVEIDKKSFGDVIGAYLRGDLSISNASSFETTSPSIAERIWQRTKEHLVLVGTTVFFAVITGVPLGVWAYRRERWGQALLLGASIVQTIPSLALLCLLIPIFGIGLKPALVALYLYSLLPILLNTYVGLRSIDPQLRETARALGLSRRRTLWVIELPLARRSIVAGIKTSTVIGIGTATLAALIGAGGYGAPIVSGLAINDFRMVLIGAVPAAVMAIIAHFVFGLLERR